MAVCVHSKHLGLKHGALYPGQIDLRKCSKIYTFGLVTWAGDLFSASANPSPFYGSREGDFSGEGLAPTLLEMREM